MAKSLVKVQPKVKRAEMASDMLSTACKKDSPVVSQDKECAPQDKECAKQLSSEPQPEGDEGAALLTAAQEMKRHAEVEAAELKRAFEMKLKQGAGSVRVAGLPSLGVSCSNEQYMALQRQAEEWKAKYEAERCVC